mgnify:CR=1 FL=1
MLLLVPLPLLWALASHFGYLRFADDLAVQRRGDGKDVTQRSLADRLPEYIRRHAPGKSFADVGCMWGVNGEYAFVAEAGLKSGTWTMFGRGEITAPNVTTALGFTPENAASRFCRRSSIRRCANAFPRTAASNCSLLIMRVQDSTRSAFAGGRAVGIG